MKHRFQLVDVFAESPYSGNPLAVVFDADDLDTIEMQRITRWFNFSETAFLLAPTHPAADYRVRIFTLDREMPFAGHPTLGSCHAWLADGGQPLNTEEIIQECGAGLISIRHSDTALAFKAPALIRSGPVEEGKVHEIAQFLGITRSEIIDAQWADNGPGWLVVLLDSAESVLNLQPAKNYAERLDLGVVGPHSSGSAAKFELRAFFTDHSGTVREDPVTGSLNASTAQWLIASGRAVAPYVTSQGSAVGRAGQIYITSDQNNCVWVGGNTKTIVSGNSFT